MKKERAREEAEQLMAKRDMEEAGEDYERSQFWGYSAESVERWNEKEDAKKARMDQRFTGERYSRGVKKSRERQKCLLKTLFFADAFLFLHSTLRLGPSEPQKVSQAGRRAQA